MRTLPQKELVSEVRKKGWNINRGEKPKPPSVSPEVKNEKLVKLIIDAINDVKSKSENNAWELHSLFENFLSAAKTMMEMKQEPLKIEEKHTWKMKVKRDDRGLIKSIIAEEL